MVAYSFQKRFAPPILAGTKLQTIRGPRVRPHVRPGQALQLYVGMRTKSCKLIATRLCSNVRPIKIDLNGYVFFHDECDGFGDWRMLDDFAVRDGFSDFEDLRRFWALSHPGVSVFEGSQIEWHPALASE